MKKLPVWAHILLAGLGSNLFAFLAMIVIVTGYATLLGFQARGAPDGDKISAFANLIAPIATLILLSLFTLIAGWRVAQRNLDRMILVGLLVGVATAAFRLVMSLASGLSSLDGIAFITIGAALAAGLCGGFLRHKRG